MSFRRHLVVLVVLATVTAGIGVPIAGVAASQETATATEESAPMGTQLTAFMQHSAAQANDSVEDGMWQSAFERANESERARMATQRADSLEDRVETLHEERGRLQALRDNATISGAEYAAEVSELNGRIEAVDEAVNGTERAAERAGLDVENLETLKRDAKNLTGAEVSGIARGLAGEQGGQPTDVGPPTDAGQPTDAGPPTDAGGPDAPGPGTNGTQGPPGNTTQGEGPGGNDQGGSDGAPGNGGNGPGAGDGAPGSSGGNGQGGSDGAPGGGGGNDSGGSDGAPGGGGGNQGGGEGNEQGGGHGNGGGNGSGPGNGPGGGNGPGNGN